jgi:hypothetical protein
MTTFKPNLEALEPRYAPSGSLFPSGSLRGTANGTASNFANQGTSFSLVGNAQTTVGAFELKGRVNQFTGSLVFMKNNVPVFAMTLTHGYGSHGITDYQWSATVNGTTYHGEAIVQFPTTTSFNLSFHT